MKNKILKLSKAAAFAIIFAYSQTFAYSQIEIEDNFNRLIVDGGVNLIIEAADRNSIFNSDDKEKVNFIYVVKNEELTIKSKSGEELNLVLNYKNLESIDLLGTATLKSNNILRSKNLTINTSSATELTLELEVDSFFVVAAGASELSLFGNANFLKANISGATELNSVDLKANYIDIVVSGASEAKLFAENSLNARASGVSQIEVVNNPQDKNIELSGMANVNFKDKKTEIEISEKNDTIKKEEGKTLSLKAESPNRENRRNRKSNFNGHLAGVELGFTNYLNPQNNLELPNQYNFLNLSQAKSSTIQINLFEQNLPLISNNLGLVTGLGWWFRNYRFDNNVVLVNDSAGITGFRDTSKNYSKSKLTTSYLVVPLLLELQTNRKGGLRSFHIAAGGYAGVKLHSRTRVVYEVNDDKQKINTPSDFHINQFEYGLTARIGWGSFNFFANYSLSTFFNKNKGPELYPISVGITLLSF